MSAKPVSAASCEQLLRLYERMLVVRRFEEQAYRFVTERKVPSTHSSIGQEATAVGICAALRPDDQILSTHRGHGHCLAKGTSAKGLMAELLGRSCGTNGGRAGSMHLIDPDVGILGANAIVGANIPMALGAAYAAACLKNDRVVVCFFGEGASSEGSCHESMNMAGLWRLPLVFVCENNAYAEHSPASVHVAVKDVASRAQGYGFPGIVVDGNDVQAVYQAAVSAVERARRGDGPTLVECKTYRMRGHFEGDPERYKPAAEKAEWATKDPLTRCRSVLSVQCSVPESEIAKVESAVESLIAEAAAFAEAGALADPLSIESHVYAGGA